MVNTTSALKKLWLDTCKITERRKVVKANKSIGFEDVDVLLFQPCKLSFKNNFSATQTEKTTETKQIVKLFISNDIKVKPGSKITVQRGNKEFEYSQSGIPAVFSAHQEILLVPFRGWA